jgi:PAS domain S-box-containing protein
MNTKNYSINETAKDLLSLLPDAAVVVDEKARLILVNDVFEALTGLNQKEVTGKSFIELGILPSESKKILLENFTRRLKGLSVENYEICLKDKNSKDLYVEVRGKRVEYQGRFADLVVFHDITRRKENARRLKEYADKMEILVDDKVKEIKEVEEKYQIISGVTSDFVFSCIKDPKGKFVIDWMAGATEKLFGYPKSEIKNRGCWKFTIHPQDLPIFQKKVIGLKPGRSHTSELRIIHKNGQTRWIQISVRMEQERSNPANHRLYGACRDITQRKNAEEIIRNAEEKYKQLFNSIPSGVAVYKPVDNGKNFVLVDFNHTAEKIEKTQKREILGKKVTDIFPGVKKLGLFKVFKHVHQTGQQEYLPSAIYKDKPVVGWRENWVYKLPDGNLVAVYNDATEKKKAEENLRESEEKLRGIFDSSPDPIVVSSLDAKIIDCNPSALKTFGYTTKTQVVQREVFEFFSEKDYARATANLSQEGEYAKNTEYTFRSKNGKEFPGELSVRPVLQASGKATCFVSTIKDITERKKMDKAIKESEEKYRTQFEEAIDAIFVADAKTGIIIDCNRAALKLVGRDKSELVGKHQRILHPSEEIEGKFSRFFRQHAKEKEGHLIETKVLTKGGEIRDVAIKANVFELQGKKLIQGIFRDITERKKIENELKLEHDKLEAVTENVGAGLAVISKDYHIIWANKLLKQIHGIDCEGKKCYSKFSQLADVCPGCGVRNVIENGAPIHSHEYTNKNDKGNQFWIELIVTPIKDQNGSVIAALELAVMITEKKLLQNKLKEYSEKLEQLVEERTKQLKQTQTKLIKVEKLAAIGELAGMVGHDLRNPLAGIKNAAYYLRAKQDSLSTENGKKMLEIIDNAIRHADKIITDLQDYSRELHLELTNCSLQSILKEALTLVQIPDKVKIKDNMLQEPLIRADEVKMVRVFINIIKNAIDAMPDGGTLQIKSCLKDGNVEIYFADTGVGMSKETMDKLFSPLVTTKAQGMGFGLAICKRILEAHQGKISVESVEGKGSTFTLILPIEQKIKTGGEDTWINVPESLLSTTTKT